MNRPIRDIVRKGKLVTATEHTTVAEAARIMTQASVGAMLVMHKERLVGIFTERDAITRVLAAGRDPAHTYLSTVMTREPRTISLDKPFGHALIAMKEHGFRHMPVMDHGHPVGVVSMRDALLPELSDLESDLQEREHITEIIA